MAADVLNIMADTSIFAEKLDAICSIVPMVIKLSAKEDNLWTASNISAPRRDTRTRLTRALGYPKTSKTAECMVSGLFGDNNQVLCGHIVPCKSPAHKIEALGLKLIDLNSIKNLVFWAAGIEHCYDRLEISFVRTNPLRDAFFLKIHTDSAKAVPLWPGSPKTVGEYDGCELNLKRHVIFKRCLSFQAYQSALRHNLTSEVIENSLYRSPGAYRFVQDSNLYLAMRKRLESEITLEMGQDGDDLDEFTSDIDTKLGGAIIKTSRKKRKNNKKKRAR